MNLLLMQEGLPSAIIRKSDRSSYIDAIEKAQLKGNLDDYYEVIYRAVGRSLDIYLDAVSGKTPQTAVPLKKLLKIGELSRETGETLHTIRHWTEKSLLEVEEKTDKGYMLYERSMIDRARRIRKLQKEKRLTLDEIAGELGR